MRSFPATPARGLAAVSRIGGTILAFTLAHGSFAAAANCRPQVIYTAPDASPVETFAARELQRYTYLCTGKRLVLRSTAQLVNLTADAVVVTRCGSALIASGADPASQAQWTALAPDRYQIVTLPQGRRQICWAVGGDGTSTLYAAYRLAELLGARFYLHGDAIPDTPQPLELGGLNESAAPLFALRGIQPFHDFPEGPDWWNREEYAAVLAQLPKLRMNFFGLHTYPEGVPNAEPTVWIGRPQDCDPRGRVQRGYPASYQNTLRGNWGYAAKPTSRYAFGAASLFERDAFGPDVMGGHLPQPTTPAACAELFDRTADLLRTAFTHARRLGVRTCVGTETPLTIPKALQEHLRSIGKDPADPAVVRELYAGIFQRIQRAYPIDYYWFWTPEGWTWEGTKEEQVRRTLDDLLGAIEVHAQLQPGFQLATCGWVLGPQQDRSLFDKVLPKNVAVSCINREVGRTPVDRGFADVRGRGKWAIPWLEDDPALTAPQLWVGRMRRDAADALRYGCDGLMGIHWRTRVLGPAVLALARAAWTQQPWNSQPLSAAPTPRAAGPEGGALAAFPNNSIADTEEDPLYQTVRYNLSAYRLPVPDGSYRVTLKFCEPHYAEKNKRVFDVKLQGRTVLPELDIFARVGQNRALDFVYEQVAVTNGWIEIEFVPRVEFPSIAAIAVEGPATRKINCGGAAWQDYEADWPALPSAPVFPPTIDFYQDWAQHEFGPEIGPVAATLFARIDGRLPRPSDWTDGPGGIRPDPRPWNQVAAEYGFVDEFAALSDGVRGLGNRERYAYWLNTFRHLRAMGRVNCLWAEFNATFERTKAEANPARRLALARDEALPARRALVSGVTELYECLLATVSNSGELGTIMNWEQHNFPGLLEKPGEELARLLGEPLPADAQPRSNYRGPTRVFVPTNPTCWEATEPLRLRALVLSEQPTPAPVLRWRVLGQGRFKSAPFRGIGRGVYDAALPTAPAKATALEYYVELKPATGPPVRFPATAPTRNQTLTLWPTPVHLPQTR